MSTQTEQIEQSVVIPPDRRITIQVPDDVPTGDARITVTITHGKKSNRVRELLGTGKGEFWMADNFDAPLELRAARKYTLNDLLAGITPENRHGEMDWGSPAGGEEW